MPKQNKTDQLRVRLTKPEREALEAIIKERGDDSTISDVIREILVPILSNKGIRQVLITPEAGKLLDKLTKILRRTESGVIETALKDAIVCGEIPGARALIPQEIALWKKYNETTT